MQRLQKLNAPYDFVKWARAMKWSLPDALEEGGDDHSLIDWKQKYINVAAELEAIKKYQGAQMPVINMPGAPTRETLYKMILGMAIARFEYRTKAGSAELIEEEIIAAEKYGKAQQDKEKDTKDFSGFAIGKKLSLTDDDIRKALVAAAEYLDIRWPEKWRGEAKRRR